MSPKKSGLCGAAIAFVYLFINALPDGQMDSWPAYLLACAGCAAFFGFLLLLYDKYGRKQVIKRRYGAPEHDCRYIFDSLEICCTECGRRWKVKRGVSAIHTVWWILAISPLWLLPQSFMQPFWAMGDAGKVVFFSLFMVVFGALCLAGSTAINAILRKTCDLSELIGKEVFPED